jgi:uncharacterized protein YdhG (YjbR/CyaY superfamily)
MAEKSKLTTIDAYIASASPEAQGILEKIRSIIKQVAPEATEIISYQMPAFKTGRVFIYFAAFKNHIGIYPPVRGNEDLEQSLIPYRGPKGNLKFPLNEPMPFDLIKRVAEALYGELGQAANV